MVLKEVKRAGYKATGARKLIIRILCENVEPPFSVERVLSCFKKEKKSRCDRASIYRNFKMLEKIGILEECCVFGETKYYEFREDITAHSTYIACRSCGKIKKIDSYRPKFSEVKGLGYSLVRYKFEISGICPACSERDG
jgi:Fe2+ or Zn2+ uptake regulation protein